MVWHDDNSRAMIFENNGGHRVYRLPLEPAFMLPLMPDEPKNRTWTQSPGS